MTLQLTVTEQLGNSLLVYGHIGEGWIVASLDPHSIVEVDSTIRLKVNVNTLQAFDLEPTEILI